MEFGIEDRQVVQAIKAVKIVNKIYFAACVKKSLLDEPADSPIFLQITLKKIPYLKSFKMIKVLLPYPLIKETSEVCLIAGDLDKKNKKAEVEPDVMHYKELLKEKGVTQITDVITLRQLRTEYKPYEAKMQLLGAFDVLLADNRITGCLPKLLGKFFFKKRKFPIQINMEAKDLKDQVKKALSQTVFYISSRGNNCTSQVSTLKSKNKMILSNIIAAVNVLAKEIPGGWDNVSGLYLKSAKSKAIPIYTSYGHANDLKINPKKEKVYVEAEELSTQLNWKVKVYPSGNVQLQRDVNNKEI